MVSNGKTSKVHWRSRFIAPNGQSFMTVLESGGFFYARRSGTDSVAFVLKDRARWGLLRCRHGGTGVVADRGFTGSLDDDSKSAVDVVIDEVAEEAGYRVAADRVHEVGPYEVGHMTDERVWLFWVDVSGLSPHPVRWQGLEARDLIGTVWNTETADWKALLVLHA